MFGNLLGASGAVDLICTIFSSSENQNKELIADETGDTPDKLQQSPRIVRLKAGKSPKLITIGEELKKDLDTTYGLPSKS